MVTSKTVGPRGSVTTLSRCAISVGGPPHTLEVCGPPAEWLEYWIVLRRLNMCLMCNIIYKTCVFITKLFMTRNFLDCVPFRLDWRLLFWANFIQGSLNFKHNINWDTKLKCSFKYHHHIMFSHVSSFKMM